MGGVNSVPSAGKLKTVLAAAVMAVAGVQGTVAQAPTGDAVTNGNFYIYNVGTGKYLSNAENPAPTDNASARGIFVFTYGMNSGGYWLVNTAYNTKTVYLQHNKAADGPIKWTSNMDRQTHPLTATSGIYAYGNTNSSKECRFAAEYAFTETSTGSKIYNISITLPQTLTEAEGSNKVNDDAKTNLAANYGTFNFASQSGVNGGAISGVKTDLATLGTAAQWILVRTRLGETITDLNDLENTFLYTLTTNGRNGLAANDGGTAGTNNGNTLTNKAEQSKWILYNYSGKPKIRN